MAVRYVAVADLHGHRAPFDAILSEADARFGADYVLVTLGDYADNGCEVPALLDRLVQLRAERGERFVPIMGNHDLALARVLGWQGAPPDEAWWHRCASYWNPGRGTGDAYGATSARDLARRMPPAHQAFVQDLPWFHETDAYVFVHAGLEAASLAPQLALLARKELPANPAFTPPPLRDKKLATVSHAGWGRTVVSGHTYAPASQVPRHRNAPHFADRWRITLSAAADRDGPLYAVVLPERRVLVADGRGPAREAAPLA